MTKQKKASVAALVVLAAWFILNLTGVRVGDFVLVVSAFVDEPIDAAFFVVFCALFFLFIKYEKVGQWLLTVFLAGWAVMQGAIYFRSGEAIKRYNDFFLAEGTHRLFPTSDTFVIKDTYHLILDILILLALVTTIIAVANNLKKHQASSQHDLS